MDLFTLKYYLDVMESPMEVVMVVGVVRALEVATREVKCKGFPLLHADHASAWHLEPWQGLTCCLRKLAYHHFP